MIRSYWRTAAAEKSASRSPKCWKIERSDTRARSATRSAVGLSSPSVEQLDQGRDHGLARALSADRPAIPRWCRPAS